MRKYNVAILGATGAVGQEFLQLIAERNFPFADLKLLASERSAGKKIEFLGKEYTVEEATADSFQGGGTARNPGPWRSGGGFQAAEPGAASGSQRLHARKPCSCAAATEGSSRTLRRAGARAGQLGRQ